MQDFSNRKSRIKQNISTYLRLNKISDFQCYKDTGITRGVLSQDNGISEDNIMRFLAYYKDVNPTWLITNEGNMTITPSNNNEDVKIIPTTSPTAGIPLIPIEAWAGALNGEEYSIMAEDCDRYIVPLFKDADFLITVRGDSMIPKYYSGDIIACRKVYLRDLWFQWGKVYIIDTDQGSVLKRVKRGSTDETITLVSENPEYDSFELRRDQIYNIAIVQGLIRAE